MRVEVVVIHNAQGYTIRHLFQAYPDIYSTRQVGREGRYEYLILILMNQQKSTRDYNYRNCNLLVLCGAVLCGAVRC